MELRLIFLFFFVAYFHTAKSLAQCSPDTEAPVAVCDDNLTALLGQNGTVSVPASVIDEGSNDNCTPPEALQLSLKLIGSPIPADTAVEFDTPGDFILELIVEDQAGNNNSCWTSVTILETYSINGKVYVDSDENCMQGGGENELAGWAVRLVDSTSTIATATTDANGYYTLLFPVDYPGDSWVLETDAPLPLPGCLGSFTVSPADFGTNNVATRDLPIRLTPGCHDLKVDIAAAFLRRCFDNQYIASYCNYGTDTAFAATLDIAFDEYLNVLSSSQPWSAVSGNTFTFSLGDIPPGGCGTITADVKLDCSAPLGATHCTEAWVAAANPCNQPSAPQIIIEEKCDEDNGQVMFTIKNIGEQDMLEPRQYYVVEDVVMLLSAPFTLPSGDSIVLNLPANGATYRAEAEQPPLSGWDNAIAVLEGCGENASGGISTGFATQLNFANGVPSTSVDCQENIGAFDPNDKQAKVKGLGDAHLVPANTAMEYKIRFQNTGTDTAFNVVIRDTLSSTLNPATIRPGAASHAYRTRLLDNNILEFVFEDIMLPDSNINEAASHGFVQFRVEQAPNLPDGERIENQAAIYFDYNEPVITNMAWHTIGSTMMAITPIENSPYPRGLEFFPNPIREEARFQVPGTAGGILRLYSTSGQCVKTFPFSGSTFVFRRGRLPRGIYFYRVESNEGERYVGKVAVF